MMDTGQWILESMGMKCKKSINLWWIVAVIAIWIACFVLMATASYASTDEQIADAIYKAEGGVKASHEYGVLKHYKHTSARQACLNTISHARKDWDGKGDFISFLGSRYAPIGVANDPKGLNRNWISNVNYFLGR